LYRIGPPKGFPAVFTLFTPQMPVHCQFAQRQFPIADTFDLIKAARKLRTIFICCGSWPNVKPVASVRYRSNYFWGM